MVDVGIAAGTVSVDIGSTIMGGDIDIAGIQSGCVRDVDSRVYA